MTKKYNGNTLTGIFNNGLEDLKITTCRMRLLSSEAHTVQSNTVIKSGGFYIGLD